jgi:hypothetical protein
MNKQSIIEFSKIINDLDNVFLRKVPEEELSAVKKLKII